MLFCTRRDTFRLLNKVLFNTFRLLNKLNSLGIVVWGQKLEFDKEATFKGAR